MGHKLNFHLSMSAQAQINKVKLWNSFAFKWCVSYNPFSESGIQWYVLSWMVKTVENRIFKRHKALLLMRAKPQRSTVEPQRHIAIAVPSDLFYFGCQPSLDCELHVHLASLTIAHAFFVEPTLRRQSEMFRTYASSWDGRTNWYLQVAKWPGGPSIGLWWQWSESRRINKKRGWLVFGCWECVQALITVLLLL